MATGQSGMVSVVIPTFNRALLLKEAVVSVLAQTYVNLEVIIVDDGSTDNTGEVVTALGDSRIRYIKKPNGGVSSARNRGIEEATGEFIAFLDSDDMWRPTKVEKQIGALCDNPAFDVCCTGFDIIGNDGRVFDTLVPKLPADGRVLDALLGGRTGFVPVQSLLVRKECLLSLRFDAELKVAEDQLFVLNLALDRKVFIIREPLLMYRRHDGVRLSLTDFEAALYYSQKSFEKFMALNSGRVDMSAKKKFDSGLCYIRGKERFRRGEPFFSAYKEFLKAAIIWPFNVKVYAWLLNPLKGLKRILRSRALRQA
ncbi:MAG: glycosyltransferase [Deltaproteobacteria bacterium]|nr:glycosyltransferase [Deltaproteobacteria bacterium]